LSKNTILSPNSPHSVTNLLKKLSNKKNSENTIGTTNIKVMEKFRLSSFFIVKQCCFSIMNSARFQQSHIQQVEISVTIPRAINMLSIAKFAVFTVRVDSSPLSPFIYREHRKGINCPFPTVRCNLSIYYFLFFKERYEKTFIVNRL